VDDSYKQEQTAREVEKKGTEDFKHITEHPEDQTPYAVFLGWQLGLKGEKLFKLYNIIGGFYHGTTLSEKSVREKGIMIREEK
jgi:hypothetical protein